MTEEFAEKAALAAGWVLTDIEWEQKQEQAALFAGDEKMEQAQALWNECLLLARHHFAADDPRLGTSYANAAVNTLNAINSEDGAALLRQAAEIWSRSAAWIDRVRLEQVARSTPHHFRMEIKNRRIYEAAAKRKLHDAAAAARRETDEMLAAGKNHVSAKAAACRSAQWQKEKPPVFGDSRKLLAACCLLMRGE